MSSRKSLPSTKKLSGGPRLSISVPRGILSSDHFFFCPRRRLSLCLCLCLCLSLCLSLYGLSVSLRVRHRRPHLSQRAPLRYSPLSTRSSLSSKMRNYESACFTCAGGLVKVQRRDETRRDETQCLYLSLNARALEPVRSPVPVKS